MKEASGKVYLVGAGPGDPGLLTLRGAELLRIAEVVVCDALANPALLAHVPAGAEVVRRDQDRKLTPDRIIKLLIDRARRGRMVVRLKGGDSYVFGRGSEEAGALSEAGIPFEVVPGVTSAVAVPAAAGIPLTQRGVASSFTVVTGHEDPTKSMTEVDLAQLAEASGTRVILMGAARIRTIVEGLRAHGLSPKTPVAMIREGTTPRQQTVVGTLGTIADLAEEAGMKPPVVTVIGEVVRLRDRLNWFESRPLSGQRVVVTRARAQAAGLIERFSALGADVLPVPSIRTAPPSDAHPLVEAITGLHGYDWLVFTSVNGVNAFLDCFSKAFEDLRDIGGVRLAAVGPATADRLRESKFAVDVMPSKFEAKAIAQAIGEQQSLENLRILLLRAEVATSDLPAMLEEKGAIVDDIACYRTVAETEIDPVVEGRLRVEGAEWLTFASGSSVEHFHARFDLPELCRRFPRLGCVSIGPESSKALAELGLRPVAEADPHTTEGLVAAVLRARSRPRPRAPRKRSAKRQL
ncbi:MAG: uroporphyrinogen-III C-methyltransferase [Verrucomicrobiae bacterium]|nr:uroporphyrinogen-III C-methyltransferase [Verrucomicrobiae bacterium]MCP5520549.1 uroporphyrinogen-III C-methyltransferase [Verrucomicrobiales bacterium]